MTALGFALFVIGFVWTNVLGSDRYAPANLHDWFAAALLCLGSASVMIGIGIFLWRTIP